MGKPKWNKPDLANSLCLYVCVCVFALVAKSYCSQVKSVIYFVIDGCDCLQCDYLSISYTTNYTTRAAYKSIKH